MSVFLTQYNDFTDGRVTVIWQLHSQRQGLFFAAMFTPALKAYAAAHLMYTSGLGGQGVEQTILQHFTKKIGDIKNTWSCTSIRPYVFMTWCLIRPRFLFLKRPLLTGQQITSHLSTLSHYFIHIIVPLYIAILQPLPRSIHLVVF